MPPFSGGGVIHTVTLTNADTLTTQFSSPGFLYDSWSIFHHPSNNSPWGTHIYPTVKPPQSQHEVQMDLETAQRSDVPSPR